MKSLLLSNTESMGGAARAAYRLYRALNEYGCASRMRVGGKQSDDFNVDGPVDKLSKLSSVFRSHIGSKLQRLQVSENLNLHSGNWLPSRWAKDINIADVDVVNLHWVAGETLSINDIGRIQKPLVWTLHDMWPFCGTEHYAADDANARWRRGYLKDNRPISTKGLDLDRFAWQRKKKAWKQPMHIIAPSNWLADCARESSLFRHWPVSMIPNVLDTNVFQPLDRSFCRMVLGFPDDKKIILFGAIGGSNDPRKGYDLLLEALNHLSVRYKSDDVMCVIFGQSEPMAPPSIPFVTQWLGHLHDDPTLALLYNAADVMVVPSRQENLPQTATEPQACGCPVVAFDCTGFRDAVVHGESGYLAHAYESEDLAEGIHWVLQSEERRSSLGQAARNRAVALWSPEVVVPQYLDAYKQTIASI